MFRTFERYAGPFAASLAGLIVALGTFSQFALPYPRRGPWPEGCHFGDALIIFIRCDASVPGFVEPVLTWSWYLTWGWFWPATFFIPMVPVIGIPLALLWLTILILGGRWIWRTVRSRLEATASARSAAS